MEERCCESKIIMWKSRRTQVIWSNYSDTIQLDDIQNKPGLFFRHLKTFLECIICIFQALGYHFSEEK